MKLRNLATALRNEPLPALIGEAGWRVIRPVRQSAFRLSAQPPVCPVRFHPIGYEALPAASYRERETIVNYADAILHGDYPLMGYGSPHLGTEPDWSLDWVSGKAWPIAPSATLPLVRHDGSDVKAPWELSRLQFLPVLAKAHVLTGDRRYRQSAQSLAAGWLADNSIGKGIHWTVAMEAALRAISLCLTIELLWPFASQETPWLERMTAGLYQHMRFIEAHSEFSFRLRSNHYLSNIVGLTTLAAYLRGPGMTRRLRKYARAVQSEILRQTYPDGGDCEASTGYHFLVAQLGLHSYRVQQRSNCGIAPAFQTRLRRMFTWMAAIADEHGRLPHLGDCDNGRVELTLDDLAQTGLPAGRRHSLATGALCAHASRALDIPLSRPPAQAIFLLPSSGLAVLRANPASVIFCAMPNGLAGRGSHTHCDKLSIIFRLDGNEVFCDAGSRCYTRSARLRNLDRSTLAHNTVTIDQQEQNSLNVDPGLLFQSGNEAAVSPIEIVGGGVRAVHQGYARLGVEHQRTVQLSDHCLRIVDELRGQGSHSVELRFILAPGWLAFSQAPAAQKVTCVLSGPRRLTLACETQGEPSLSVVPAEISREFGAALRVDSLRIHSLARLPATISTHVRWD